MSWSHSEGDKFSLLKLGMTGWEARGEMTGWEARGEMLGRVSRKYGRELARGVEEVELRNVVRDERWVERGDSTFRILVGRSGQVGLLRFRANTRLFSGAEFSKKTSNGSGLDLTGEL